MNINKIAIDNTVAAIKNHLLQLRTPDGYWQGRLSSSALSTATAVFALAMVDKERYKSLICKGLDWLRDNCNTDGGWGDTTDSISNISTTLLCWSAFSAADDRCHYDGTISKAKSWLAGFAGGTEPEILAEAVNQKYDKDKTFSAPILTMYALAMDSEPHVKRGVKYTDTWRLIKPLPFELAVLPHQFFKWLRLPVVSYAMPALIAIGYAGFYHRKPGNPIIRALRYLTRNKALAVLRNIQPESGGFLEAVPLTAFVVMSLAACGEKDNEVVTKGTEFLAASARDDGSWPIDTNLATWVTTLSINAFAEDTRDEGRGKTEPRPSGSGKTRDEGRLFSLNDQRNLQRWLLSQQYRKEHPYTHANPGGWAWTNLSGAVPDADDTAGALIALRNLGSADDDVIESATAGVKWLLKLQNRDGGIPTFCRGWMALPFDQSAPDITAHAIRAFNAWIDLLPNSTQRQVQKAIRLGLAYLKKFQREDGSWVPLWFGNQLTPNQENPVYGTARVLKGLNPRDGLNPTINWGAKHFTSMIEKGLRWLLSAQNQDGGWGISSCVVRRASCEEPSTQYAIRSTQYEMRSTIEETAVAVDALAEILFHLTPDCREDENVQAAVSRGANWLIEQTNQETSFKASPIGLYFARLWYSEELYPAIFTVSALQKVQRLYNTKGYSFQL